MFKLKTLAFDTARVNLCIATLESTVMISEEPERHCSAEVLKGQVQFISFPKVRWLDLDKLHRCHQILFLLQEIEGQPVRYTIDP